MRHIPIQIIGQFLEISCDSDLQVTGYQIDSRRINPGELFLQFAVKEVDGHQYLEEVKLRGAVGALVSKDYEGADFGLILLAVDDVLASLQGLAHHFMRDCKSLVIGVTGSIGKTTTKEFIATLLEGKLRLAKLT